MIQPTAESGTPSVTLRPANSADAGLLHRWRHEGSVRRFQPLSDVSPGQLRAELAAQRPGDLEAGRGERFQWIVLVDGRPGGWITLVVNNWDHGLAEIGYALTTDQQGRGVMPAALEQLVSTLFLTTRLERIEARCAVDNRSSQRVLERLGFQREGRLRHYFELRGERVDNWLYAILRTDWMDGIDPGSGS